MVFKVYTQQVADAPVRSYRQRIDDPRAEGTAALAQGVTRAASGVTALADQLRQEQDTAAVQRAWAELATSKQSLLDDPENGFITSRRGLNAVNERNSVIDYYQKFAESLSDKLDNDDQRAAFAALLERDRLGFVHSIDRHVAHESEVLKKQSRDAAMTAAVGEAVSAARRGEYGKVRQSIGMGAAAVGGPGDDPAYTAVERKAFETDAHLGVLRMLVDQGRGLEAREYLAAVRSSMDEVAIGKSHIDKVVAAAGVEADGRALAEQVWETAEGDPAQAAKLLREKGIKDTALFDEAMKRVQQRGAETDQARRQADSPRLGRIEQRLLSPGPWNPKSDTDFADLSDEGKANALRMWRAEQRSRRETASRERNLQTQIDRDADADYRALVANEPEQAVQADIVERYADASGRQRNLILERQGRLRQTLEGERGVPLKAFQAQAREEAQRLSFNKARTSKFMSYMTDAYFEWMQDPKNERLKAPPPDVVQKMIGDALLYGERARSEGFFQPNMYAFEAAQRGVEFAPFDKEGEAMPPAGETPASAGGPTPSAIRRTDPTTGETRVWNGSTWVKE